MMRPVRPCGDVDCPCQGGTNLDTLAAVHARAVAAEARVAVLAAELAAVRAELSVLRATDGYQRWARAVVERDAARAEVERVSGLLAAIAAAHTAALDQCRREEADIAKEQRRAERAEAAIARVDDVLAQALVRRSLPETRRAIENVRDELRAALAGPGATT